MVRQDALEADGRAGLSLEEVSALSLIAGMVFTYVDPMRARAETID